MLLSHLFRRDTDWQPVIDFRAPANDTVTPSPRSWPLVMRRRSDGKYIYRAPTQEEVQDYVTSEAW